MYCAHCGKPKWSWVHAINHPATQGAEEVHEFVECSHPNEEPTGKLDSDGGTLVVCLDCGHISNTGVED